MKNYEVRLTREATQKVHATVSVFAETEVEAIDKAKAHARLNRVDEWSSLIGEATHYGEIAVESVEAIVDIDETP
jgi:hypothetical protein